MAKFQSPLLGYNNNVRHKNRVFHIQTEDSGVNHPHIITHLFMDGGRILKSVKKSYAEHVGTEGMKETVRGLMKEQHKAIFIALRDGQFDALVDGGNATAAKAAAPVAPPTAVAAPEAAALAPEDEAAAALAPRAEAAAALAPEAEAEAAPEAEAAAASGVPATSPEPARFPSSAELPPVTIDETKRPRSILPPPSGAQIAGPRIQTLPPPPLDRDDVPMTTRQPPEARPDAATASKSSHDLTLDFDQLEQAALDGLAAPSLFHSADLPPPPKNLFAKEPGTGGAYRTVEANPGHTTRRDAREEPAARMDPREEPEGAGPVSKPGRTAPARIPASRPSGEARYAPARPAAIFGSTQRPPPTSLFSDDLVSDKSLDEVILSYLAEDLEPPHRK